MKSVKSIVAGDRKGRIIAGDHKGRPYMVCLIVIWAIGAYVFFQTCYSYTFFYKEQNQLFLLSSEYIGGYFSKHAWLSCLIGDFLTQFYYYVYAGPVIYSLLILLTGIVSYLAFRRLGLPCFVSCLIALIVETLLTVFNFDPDYRTSAAVSLTGTVGMLLLWAGLMRFCFAGDSKGGIAGQQWSDGGGAPSLQGLCAVLGRRWSGDHEGRPYRGVLKDARKGRPYRGLIKFGYGVVCCVAAWWMFGLGLPSIGKLSTPYYQLEDYLEADCLYYFGKDDELAEKVEAMKKEDVTGVISAYYYMSKSRQGMLPQSVGKVSPVNLGTLFHIGPKSSIQEIKLMAEFYFLLGDMTMTERAAMIALVSSPDKGMCG